MKEQLNKRKKSQGGNAVVEFALGWSILSLLFFGVYHYGYSFYMYNLLQTSVSNASQFAARLDYDTASPNTFTSQIQNFAMYGDPAATVGKKLIPGIAANNVSVNVTLSNSIPIDVTVTVSSFTFSTIFSSTTFTKPRVTVAYSGHVTCSTC